MTYKVKANAKVNLHLEVLNKRSDSYHNIFSLNASLDLFDRLTFKRLNILTNVSAGIQIEIYSEGGKYPDIIGSIATEDNLISKAARSYFSRVGRFGEISIAIEKNIPAGAGLGGGSSDAAAVLRLLNDYFAESGEGGLSEGELFKLGAEIGADIPYCLSGGYSFCEGTGEIIENIKGELNYWILIVNCNILINTASAYNALKRSSIPTITESEITEKKNLFKQGFKEGNISKFKHILKNDFEATAFSKYPELKIMKEEILSFEPEYSTMTGSGSSLIALFRNKKSAENAMENLGKKAKVIIARFL